jgi:ATP-binding cassette subfamily B protein
MKTMSGMSLDSVKAALSSAGDERDSCFHPQSRSSPVSVTASSSRWRLFCVKEEYLAIGLDVDQMQTDYLLTAGAKMLGLTFLMIMVAIMAGFMASRTAAGIGRNLRASLFSGVLSFSSREIERFSTASLITRSTNDIQQVQMVLVMLLRLVLYAPILGIGGIIRVTSTHTGMGWIIGVAVGTILMLIVFLMRIAMPKFKKMQVLIDKLNLVSREILTGIPVIRAFSRERHEEKRFDAASYDLMRTQLFTNRVMAFMMPTMMLIMNVITLMIVWFGAKGIDLGNLQVGDMMAFMPYTIQIIMSFMILSMVSIKLPRGNVPAERNHEVVSTVPSISDKPACQTTVFRAPDSLNSTTCRLSSPAPMPDVLDHISFQARPALPRPSSAVRAAASRRWFI